MEMLLECTANRIMEYQLKQRFAFTTKSESYIEFKIVLLKIVASALPFIQRQLKLSDSNLSHSLGKKCFMEKISYRNTNVNAAPASVPSD